MRKGIISDRAASWCSASNKGGFLLLHAARTGHSDVWATASKEYMEPPRREEDPEGLANPEYTALVRLPKNGGEGDPDHNSHPQDARASTLKGSPPGAVHTENSTQTWKSRRVLYMLV